MPEVSALSAPAMHVIFDLKGTLVHQAYLDLLKPCHVNELR